MSPTEYRHSHHALAARYDEGPRRGPWDAYIHGRHAEILGKVVPELFPDGVGRYLDFACGTGRITVAVAPFARKTVGVDIAEEMMRHARPKLPDATFVCADLTTEDVDLGAFDLVTAFRFFGNAEQVLREQAVHEIARRQEPGGVLIGNNHRNPNAVAARLARLRGQRDGMDLTHGKFIRTLEGGRYRIERVVPIGVWAWRASMKDRAGRAPTLDAKRERRWSAPWLASVAPDCVAVARRY